ncbi:MAG: homocysteine S-methyltransferase [Candidatus Competibacter sp.]|nr:homocysteine S-methyltransferase [Candidatus Competibacter sp.]
MNPIATLLERYPVLVLDGAMATELEHRGRDLRDPLWSAKVLIEAPELIREVHLDYFLAGADVAITASYQATVEGFMRRGLGREEGIELLRRSVRLAVEARDAFWEDPANRVGRPRPLVAASVGPYGAFLADGSEYRGDYDLSEAELMDFHRPRLAALLEAGPDLLACETIPCFAEARALARLLAEFPGAGAWISFSARDEARVCHGESLAECAAWLDGRPQVVAVGVNCTAPSHIPALIAAARVATGKPIVVYPNSGETYDPESHRWEGVATCADFAAEAQIWHKRGARLIGGCCRTTPDHIREIAAWSRRLA